MKQSNNFIQSHARNRRYVSNTVAQMQAVDSFDATTDSTETPKADSLNDLQRAEVVTRRLDEAVLRLDRAASMRRLREKQDLDSQASTAESIANPVDESATPVVPAPKANAVTQGGSVSRPSERLRPALGDRHDEASGMQLDASVTETTSIWMETEDQSTRLRIDRPIDVDETARRLGEPLIVSGVARVSDEPIAPTQSPVENVVEPMARFAPVPQQVPPTVVEQPHVAPEPVVSPAPSQRMPMDRPVEVSAPQSFVPAASVIPESTPSAPTKPVGKRPFMAAWQVDELEIPETVSELFLCGSLADQLGQHIVDAQKDGLNTIAVTSVLPGEGRSTVAMGVALSVAFTGMKVALVDADSTGPTLVDDFALELDQDWIDAVRDGIPVEEIAVSSEADALTLVPLLHGAEEMEPSTSELEQVIERLKQSFDLVIVDCGTSAFASAGLCDSALIVRDTSRCEADDVETLAQALRRQGVTGVGVVENFCQDID
ncbi:P-loop NTPase [Rhodopirellula sp. JC740]|uniref:P-loop NTPase n=1 Tax=Rhodopirellula halodulae TaxID=2894198 RepID=A0ABS8NEE6_9BACT|nr:P-loop NTPase [Rhodopirellula sp. JC740]MCC9641302.1 P-loop NTPase [Rhodopirellula sp. JC740]